MCFMSIPGEMNEKKGFSIPLVISIVCGILSVTYGLLARTMTNELYCKTKVKFTIRRGRKNDEWS